MQLTVTKPQKAMGARLKAERERLGYTELQIAQLIGIPLERYQEEEEGKVDPGIFCMPRLSDCGFDVLFIITARPRCVVHHAGCLGKLGSQYPRHDSQQARTQKSRGLGPCDHAPLSCCAR